MKLLNNQILVEPIHRDRIGNIFIPDNSDDARQYVSVIGIVKQLPEKLVYSKNNYNSVHVKTTIELKVGDTVWYHFLCYSEAANGIDRLEYQSGRSLPASFIEYEGKRHLLLNYNDCYCAKRGDDVFALNGYVLAEPDEREKTKLILPDRDQTPIGLCTVLSTGHLIEEYKFGMETIIPPDDPTIVAGDRILIPMHRGNMVEKFHDDIIKGKKIYFFQRRDILCKITDNSITPISDRLLIKPHEQEEKKGSIFIPQTVESRGYAARAGEVVASGVFATIQPGTTVHYDHSYSSRVEIGGNKWVAVRQTDILYAGH